MFSADLGGVTASSTPASNDPPFQKVALLLHGDGTNGAQNNTFVDSSTNNFTITRTGNVAQGTFSPFSLAEGQWSNYFDGSVDYLTFDGSSSASFGTGKYTVEGWFYLTDISGNRQIFDCRPTTTGIPWGCEFQTGAPSWYNGASRTSTTAVTTNTWNHVAFVREGTGTNQAKIYINGSVVHTFTDTVNYGTMNTASRIGYNLSNVNSFAGFISNLRVVKGTAVYTANFIPPTSALTAISGTSLLTCQSNRFKDNSSNNFTITRNGDTKVTAFSPFAPSAAYSASTNGGSGYFDGSGDYLSIADNASLNMGSSDFTLETFVYINALPSVSQISLINKDGKYAVSWAQYALGLTSGGKAYAQFSSVPNTGAGPTASITGSITLRVGEWNHIAVTRTGTTAQLWVNGIQDGTTSTVPSTLNNGARALLSGYEDSQPSTFYFNGYLTNQRVIKGTALYTTNFTPPTAPLTAVTNTQLLLNCVNAGIYDNAGKNDIETVGNAQISTSVKKYGTGSMYFDGSGDSLNTLNNPNLQFGTGDFTIEMWVYKNNNTGPQSLVSKWAVGDWGLFFYPNSSIIQFAKPTVTSYTTIVSDSSAFATGQWVHVAVTRASGTTRLFINGNVVSTASDTNNYSSTMLLSVGTLDGSNFPFNGYIDDLRITKGQALYTSNFTPPTQAFPDV